MLLPLLLKLLHGALGQFRAIRQMSRQALVLAILLVLGKFAGMLRNELEKVLG